MKEIPDEAADSAVEERSRLRLVGLEREYGGAFECAAEAEQAIQEKALTASRWEKRATKWRSSAVALAVFVVVGLAVVVSYFWISSRSRPPATDAHVKSIAVLPFKPLAADSRNESLELGMADTLITKLSSIREITVLSIDAVRKYASLDQNPIAAGRESRGGLRS